jgi:hypothetical protein
MRRAYDHRLREHVPRSRLGPAAGRDVLRHGRQPARGAGSRQQPAISDKEQTTFLGPVSHVSHKGIAKRAFAMFQARGSTHGSDVQDWLSANKELIAERQSS